MSEPTNANIRDARRAVIDALHNRAKKARFITELAATLGRLNIEKDRMEQALTELENEGVVMIRDHFCADPHLVAVDLRVVALVESAEGADAQMHAIHEIDSAWDKWLADYLSNHRCT
jgi:hypothetical protein